LEKCKIMCAEVDYLGMRISVGGIGPIPGNLSAILEMKYPTDKKELREFLGLVNYYREYCPDLAAIAHTLFRLTRKETSFSWGPEEAAAVGKIKALLTTTPVLGFADPNKPFILATDASNVALGAVLSQVQKGKEVPLAYASRVLSATEEKYSVVEKELLAIVFAVKKFNSYLYGTSFTVLTDHNPLQYALTLKDTSR